MSNQEILGKAISKAVKDYEIAPTGRVWNKKSGKEILGSINTNGYRRIKIYDTDTKKSKNVYIHKLVALKLIPNPKGLKAVNHIDGNKLNNAVWNLEWCTQRENMHHAWDNGLLPKPPHIPGEKAGNHKLSWEQVREIRDLKIQGYTNVALAERFGVHHTTIASIVNNQTWVISPDPIKYLGENIDI